VQPECASRQNSLDHRRPIFFIAAQPVDAYREIRPDYDGWSSGPIIYTYVGGNPISRVDPTGLDTYVASRDLASFGNSARSLSNPITHTFTFSTNPNGTVASTYSWGNAANLNGWNLNQPEDLSAAAEALSKGLAQLVAPAYIDPYFRRAFDKLNNPANNHTNGILTWIRGLDASMRCQRRRGSTGGAQLAPTMLAQRFGMAN
jgi:hypothetical protein